MTNQLPLAQRFVAGVSTRTVSARILHDFLHIKRDFSSWIKNRIEQYKFEENQDFILIHQNGGIKKRGGDRKSIEYYLTLDMAKELCMVERNERGREARRYFIACEKKLAAKRKAISSPDIAKNHLNAIADEIMEGKILVDRKDYFEVLQHLYALTIWSDETVKRHEKVKQLFHKIEEQTGEKLQSFVPGKM